jgi:hypothetical protein
MANAHPRRLAPRVQHHAREAQCIRTPAYATAHSSEQEQESPEKNGGEEGKKEERERN